jgi:acetolactate synthase I/II/III large subunit
MNCQELATAAEENVNVKIVLFNNNSLGLVHQQQDLFYGKRLFASDYRARVDFVRLAESLGVKATIWRTTTTHAGRWLKHCANAGHV